MKAVVGESISKSYSKGQVQALKNVSFEINEGEIFGFIGPDGAGKTSLFRILTTLLLPDNGKASVLGLDVIKDYRKIRNIVGYMPGRFSLYQDLTVEENLKFFATIFGTTIKENYEYIKEIYCQIEPFKDRLAGKLSGGMKQKLALSCAMIHKPELLILDEPTTGVDAVSRVEFWEMLERLKNKGITIIVSTPYMDEAELCDRIALIKDGELLSIDTPQMIVEQNKRKIYAAKADNMYKLTVDLKNYEYTESVYPFGQYLHYSDKRETANIKDINEYISQKGHIDVEFKEIKPCIEDCFMDLIKIKTQNSGL